MCFRVVPLVVPGLAFVALFAGGTIIWPGALRQVNRPAATAPGVVPET